LKVFWGIMGLAFAAVVALLAYSQAHRSVLLPPPAVAPAPNRSAHPRPTPPEPASLPAPPAETAPVPAPRAPQPQPLPAPPQDQPKPAEPAAPAVPVPPADSSPPPAKPAPEAAPVPEPKPEPKPTPPPAPPPAPEARKPTAGELSKPTSPPVKSEVPNPKSETPPPAAPSAADSASLASKVKLVPQDDGSVLVDDRYVMKGKGTKESPYVITWDMLTSAEETYQPRRAQKTLPERVKMLDGKWVKISGYVAFPVMAASNDEMLAMLNQWDGCCIGVPPTPYDAIEVKLKEPAKGEARLRVNGAVTGKFRVDPYLVKDWLVSLYLMDDAVVSDQ